jgi:hypothetical protein
MDTGQWIGTIGVTLILVAYFLSVFNRLNAKSAVFFTLNVLGSGLACYASWLINYWPFVFLEGTWLLVSLAGLVKATGTNKNREQEN